MWNSLLAIAAGALVDQLSSWYLFGWFSTALLKTGIPFGPVFWAVLTIANWLGMDIVGGYVTGCLAKRNKTAHAAITGTVILCFAIALILWGAHSDPWDGFCLVATVPCETFGGWLASRLQRPKPGAPRGPAPPIASPT